MIDQATVLLNLAQDQLHQIPAKTYEHLASGREVLTICEANSDTGRLLASVEGVTCVEPNDAPRLRDVLRDLYQRHAVQGVPRVTQSEELQRFSRDSQLRHMESIVRAIVRTDRQ